MFKDTSILVLAMVLGSTGLAQAKDVYYDIPIRDLKLIEGRLPDNGKIQLRIIILIEYESSHGAVRGS